MLDTLLDIQLVSTLFMCGLIWFVQVVHYPLMSQVGLERFSDYERHHQSRTTLVVAIPMLAEAFAAGALLWMRPEQIPLELNLVGAGLVAIIWVSTIIWQMPAHHSLAGGFDAKVHRKLVLTNWVRTVAWTLRAGICCWMGGLQ